MDASAHDMSDQSMTGGQNKLPSPMMMTTGHLSGINHKPVTLFSGITEKHGYVLSLLLAGILPVILELINNLVFSTKLRPQVATRLAIRHITRTLCKMVQYSSGMILMLLIMSLNLWIIISVLISSTLGYFITAWIKTSTSNSHQDQDRSEGSSEETKSMLEREDKL